MSSIPRAASREGRLEPCAPIAIRGPIDPLRWHLPLQPASANRRRQQGHSLPTPLTNASNAVGCGSSFSNNALLYLPKIVQSAGDQIVVKSASIGDAPLEMHWDGVAPYVADPDAREGKIY